MRDRTAKALLVLVGLGLVGLFGWQTGVSAQRGPCDDFSGRGRIPYCGSKPGIYAIVDVVAFEPNVGPPERVRITGTFVIPLPVSSGLHQSPQRGMLYFSLTPEREASVRKDWAALAAAAGTDRVVGFAEYWVSRPLAPGDRAYEAGGRGGTMNTSLVVNLHAPGAFAEPEPYPLPHELGVITDFERPGDQNPRFGRPSAEIIAELQEAARRSSTTR